MNAYLPRAYAALLVLLASLLSGCAANSVRDPLEPLNRGIYAFNDAVDSVVLKPVATGYREVVPSFIRTGVSNFFSNLDDIVVVINGVLQLKIPQAFSDAARFLVNSTVGLLGFIDVATHLGLEKHNEDFGQTLGYWGIGDGPYLVLPFFGPSSLRDGIGRWVDQLSDTVRWQDHIRTRNQLLALRAVSQRAGLLGSEKVLETAAIDEYAFIRDAYLQRRRSLVYDGNPPPEKDEDEPAKPRSEAPPAPVASRLEDQWGTVVGSGENQTPIGGYAPELLRKTAVAPKNVPAAAPAPPMPVQPDSRSRDPAPAISDTAAPSSAGMASKVRIVRVWLPASAH